MICFLKTPVLRFALLPYYRRTSNKTQALTKSVNMNISVVGILNSLFRRGCYTEILLVSILVFDMTVLYENVAFSISVFSTKTQYSVFFKKRFLFIRKLLSKSKY